VKVLIVDDHEIVRDGLALLLQDFFTIENILFASEGWEAIKKALAFPVDLILLDLSMPGGLDGLQTAEELIKIQPQAKIVFFSMYEEEVYQQKAYEVGAHGFLVKRLTGEEIIAKIKEILAGNKVFSHKILDINNEEDRPKTQTPWDLPFTKREKEVFILTVLGHSQKEIAEKMNISVRTVENHRHHISKKIGSSKKSDWMDIARKYNIETIY
jgi:two-component system response regulator NreC